MFGHQYSAMRCLFSAKWVLLVCVLPSGRIPQGLFNSTPNLREICLGSNRLTEAIPDNASSLLKLQVLVLEKKLRAPCHLLCPIFPGFKHYLLDGTISHFPFLEMRAFTSLFCECWSKNYFNKSIPLGLSACQNWKDQDAQEGEVNWAFLKINCKN
jgi:hypothetical protein